MFVGQIGHSLSYLKCLYRILKRQQNLMFLNQEMTIVKGFPELLDFKRMIGC